MLTSTHKYFDIKEHEGDKECIFIISYLPAMLCHEFLRVWKRYYNKWLLQSRKLLDKIDNRALKKLYNENREFWIFIIWKAFKLRKIQRTICYGLNLKLMRFLLTCWFIKINGMLIEKRDKIYWVMYTHPSEVVSSCCCFNYSFLLEAFMNE